MESWLTSSVKDMESALILTRYGVHGAFLELPTEINIHIDLRRVSQGISKIYSRSQATCTVCCGTWDSNGASEGEMGFISSLFGVHRAIFLS